MISNQELEGFCTTGYFSRAWALLTKDKGWWKPVLICAAACLVPIVGPIAVAGYGYEWARRVAWGSTAGPDRQVKVGELITSGWRVAVVSFGWSFVMILVGQLLGETGYLSTLLTFVWDVFSIFLGLLAGAACLRATIYQSFKAGYRVPTIWEMGTRDVAGLLKVWLIEVVFGVVVAFVAALVLVPVIMAYIPTIIGFVDYMSSYTDLYYYYYGSSLGFSDAEIVSFVFEFLGWVLSEIWPSLLIAWIICQVVAAAGGLVKCAALGLWMRQFNVPAWGREEDPLPQNVWYAAALPQAMPAQQQAPDQAPSAWQAAPTVQVQPVPVEQVQPVVQPAAAEQPAQEETPVQEVLPAEEVVEQPQVEPVTETPQVPMQEPVEAAEDSAEEAQPEAPAADVEEEPAAEETSEPFEPDPMAPIVVEPIDFLSQMNAKGTDE